MARKKEPGACSTVAAILLIMFLNVLWIDISDAWSHGNFIPGIVLCLVLVAAGLVAWAVHWVRMWGFPWSKRGE